jgi:hypothetical protein
MTTQTEPQQWHEVDFEAWAAFLSARYAEETAEVGDAFGAWPNAIRAQLLAKHQILRQYLEADRAASAAGCNEQAWIKEAAAEALHGVIVALATPYADHPDHPSRTDGTPR